MQSGISGRRLQTTVGLDGHRWAELLPETLQYAEMLMADWKYLPEEPIMQSGINGRRPRTAVGLDGHRWAVLLPATLQYTEMLMAG